MAQTGFTPIQIYRSSTASAAPTSGNLVDGELAINTTDGKLFYLDNLNAVQVIGWKLVPVSAGGTGTTTSTGTGSVVLSNSPTITGSPNIGVALGTYISIGTGTSDPLETASITAIGGNLSIEGEPTLQSAISYIPFTFNSSVTANSLTGSQAVFTDGSKNLISRATTGTGSVVLSSYLPASTIVGITDTQALSNKRINPRVLTTASNATPTINTNNTDQFGLTAQAVDITSFTTNLSGTPTDGQKLWIYIVGTAARAITWGASFESSTATLPTTTVTTNRLDIGFVWNAATSKWRCVAVA